ncbi:MAG TPA: hypothetical protein DCM28_15230 [Phycisphaerales bacterium]|nr:hypothetical protein [Phycisphaerales bacterium]HCD32738.1 hypothetical protein [Phycisphaerales bacterium]|tara:strand:- start:626 stop:1207 length:582 start_codon:yes stop_codon:yes gene_type:complete
MRNYVLSFGVSVLMLLLGVSPTYATPLDLHRAVSGADRPFTTLKDNLPTEWNLWLEPRITGPAGGQKNWDFHFPERSFGNIFNATQSHILGIGTRRRMVEGDLTGIWLIWDMLAWVPVPHLLYLETVEPMGTFEDPWFNIEHTQTILGSFFIPIGNNDPINVDVVPEPTSGALILIGSLMLMSRATRRRYARV